MQYKSLTRIFSIFSQNNKWIYETKFSHSSWLWLTDKDLNSNTGRTLLIWPAKLVNFFLTGDAYRLIVAASAGVTPFSFLCSNSTHWFPYPLGAVFFSLCSLHAVNSYYNTAVVRYNFCIFVNSGLRRVLEFIKIENQSL